MSEAASVLSFSDFRLAHRRAGKDLVMGNRFRGGIMPGAMPWKHRWIGNPVLSGLGRLFFRSSHPAIATPVVLAHHTDSQTGVWRIGSRYRAHERMPCASYGT